MPVQDPKSGASAEKPAFSLTPSVTLPKGGGAIQGIDEKHAVSAATGSASASVGLGLSPGRNLSPSLGLSYDAGNGNGPFGLGWSLSLPSISRKTAKGVPRYRKDSAGLDLDTFVLAGADDLVPIDTGNPNYPAPPNEGRGCWADNASLVGWKVQRYAPRVESGFARIELWTPPTAGAPHWRVVGADNSRSIYGLSAAARVADPSDPTRVGSWLLEEVRDGRGEIVRYTYVTEDSTGVDFTAAWEAHRRGGSCAQRYLKRVQYGNRTPDVADQWMFEAVLDYGDHPGDAPTRLPTGSWKVRQDPFSSNRFGFEVRTWRLCERVLVFHNFTELRGSTLVRSTAFTYNNNPTACTLSAVVRQGHRDGNRVALPTVRYAYQSQSTAPRVAEAAASTLADVPAAWDPAQAQWVDLDGEGLAGLLIEVDGAWYYKRNLGNGQFAAVAAVKGRPSFAGDEPAQLTDLDGDGRLELVSLRPGLAGSQARAGEGWDGFKPFSSLPRLDWSDPNLRWIDLDGDGNADLLLTEERVHWCYPSLGAEGWGAPEAVTRALDEAKGPAVVFSDGTGTVMLADMDGDGLVDIVRIRNSEICYWPNLGYGRFGPRVRMGGAPTLDRADLYDPGRVRLSDVDGTGPTDLLYIGRDGVDLYRNQGGNRWGAAERLPAFPGTDDHAHITVADLLGKGTACLIWSSTLPSYARSPLRYLDLHASGKPWLLSKVTNGLGAETTWTWTSSVRYYLEDRTAGQPWRTRVPFPVHVVEKVEATDRVSGHRAVSTYRYRDGWYDGVEREFGGFGRVDQEDTEAFGAWMTPEGRLEADLLQPPVRVRTWFHTGALVPGAAVGKPPADQVWKGDGQAGEVGDCVLPDSSDQGTVRQAARALRGTALRVETYALDGTEKAGNPYTVAETRVKIRQIQGRRGKLPAIVQVLPHESVSWTYDRVPDDPRVTSSYILEYDRYGAPVKVASVAFPRRAGAARAINEQSATVITVAETDLIHVDQHASGYRLGLTYGSKTWELTGVSYSGSSRPSAATILRAWSGATNIAYEVQPTAGRIERRRVERTVATYMDDNNPESELAWGQAGPLGLPGQSMTQVFTAGLLSATYGDRLNGVDLTTAGFVQRDGDWWAASGTQRYSKAAFYRAVKAVDPFGAEYALELDTYKLYPVKITDPSGLAVEATHDYHALQPRQLKEPNGTVSAVAFDALGLVTKSAVTGPNGEGSTLAQPSAWMEYTLREWTSGAEPNYVHLSVREEDRTDARVQETRVYWDGAGQVFQQKLRVDPDAGTPNALRVVASGRVIKDNKGNPVKQYEPFFSDTWACEAESAAARKGVTPILRYDPAGRLIRTDLPDGTFTRVVFNPWEQESWDNNDTVTESVWYRSNSGTDAGRAAAAHANTPARVTFDVLGRPVIAIAHNRKDGVDERLTSTSVLDVEGNLLKLTDPRGVVISTRTWSIGGALLKEVSPDGGTRWSLPDTLGQPWLAWTERGYRVRVECDRLRRPVASWLREPGATTEKKVGAVEFGGATAEVGFRGRVRKTWDDAGMSEIAKYDFRGSPLQTRQRLRPAVASEVDWSQANADLDSEVFSGESTYDALGRVRSATGPDGTLVSVTYRRDGQIETQVLKRGTESRSVVQGLTHNARGQRTEIRYGNGVTTSYSYDPKTWRLTRLKSVRGSDREVLQDLQYTFDPAGNLLKITDGAWPTTYNANTVVAPTGTYVYDALYRLIEATGREHPGQCPTGSEDSEPIGDRDAGPSDFGVADAQRLLRYTERYTYDTAGNILEMSHRTSQGAWRRRYQVATDSNRLLKTSRAGVNVWDSYTHDVHGNMTAMPHLSSLVWNAADQLRRVVRTGLEAVYTYAGGQRARKRVLVSGGGVRERIYLGGYERYRELAADGSVRVERHTVHASDGGRRALILERTAVEDGAALAKTNARWQLDNHLGSACVEVDDVGAVISYEEYHPYGTAAWRAGKSAAEVGLKRYRYTGMERDEETGLSYHTARYYAPWLGRWVSADPIGVRGGGNLFEYAGSRPTAMVDATGTSAVGFEDEENLESIEVDEQDAAIAEGLMESANPAENRSRNVRVVRSSRRASSRSSGGHSGGPNLREAASSLSVGPILVSDEQLAELADIAISRESSSVVSGMAYGLLGLGALVQTVESFTVLPILNLPASVSKYAQNVSMAAESTDLEVQKHYVGAAIGNVADVVLAIPTVAAAATGVKAVAKAALPAARAAATSLSLEMAQPATAVAEAYALPRPPRKLTGSSPVEIPDNAKVVRKIKDAGYDQASYTWKEGGLKFEARWHTRTPGAPINQGDTWVIRRTTPGNGSSSPLNHYLTDKDFSTGKETWTSAQDWFNAISARKSGIATDLQNKILTKGHWPAP